MQSVVANDNSSSNQTADLNRRDCDDNAERTHSRGL